MADNQKQPFMGEFWRPDEGKLLVRRQPRYGWGWTVNFAELSRRVSRLRRVGRAEPQLATVSRPLSGDTQQPDDRAGQEN